MTHYRIPEMRGYLIYSIFRSKQLAQGGSIPFITACEHTAVGFVDRATESDSQQEKINLLPTAAVRRECLGA